MKALDVAKYFVYLSHQDDTFTITPLKLQKLLYYAQGFNVLWDKKLLISEEFHAWKYGPVIPDIYDQYKIYGQKVIPVREGSNRVGTKDERETIEAVWRDYKIYGAFELVRMTHLEDPWIDAVNGNGIISNEDIIEYFENAYY
jgi:uncharacterized phage-associated protein